MYRKSASFAFAALAVALVVAQHEPSNASSALSLTVNVDGTPAQLRFSARSSPDAVAFEFCRSSVAGQSSPDVISKCADLAALVRVRQGTARRSRYDEPTVRIVTPRSRASYAQRVRLVRPTARNSHLEASRAAACGARGSRAPRSRWPSAGARAQPCVGANER